MIDETGRNLVFLLGLPRSGTTLLAAMLANHSAIFCPPEPWLMLALQAFGTVHPSHPADSQAIGEATREFLPDPTPSMRAFALDAYNRKLEEAGRSVFVDKTPRYYLILPYLAEMFPQARFIWLQRNPLAVALSYQQTWGIDLSRALQRGRLFDAAASGDGADQLKSRWVPAEIPVGLDRLARFAGSHADRVHTLQYEKLVREPEAHLRQILNFLDLPEGGNLAELHLENSAFATSYAGDKKILATSGPHTRSVDLWAEKLDGQQIQTLLNAIGPDRFRQLGYVDVLDRCREMGVAVDGSGEAQAVLEEAEALLAQLAAEMHGTSRASGGVSGMLDEASSRGLLANGSVGLWSREVHRVARELDVHRRTAEEAVARVAALEASLSDARGELEQVQAERQRLQTDLEQARADNQQQQKLLATARQEAADRAEQLAAAEQREAALKESVAQLTADLDAARTSAQAVAEERNTYVAWVHQLRSELTAIRTRAFTLEAERQYREDMGPLDRIVEAAQGTAKLLGRRVMHHVQRRRERLAARAVRPDLPPPSPPLPSMTIVTPVYNGAAHIRECIESVLNQDYPNLQYIIIDGGSTDGTQEIVREYGNRISLFISEPDHGMYDAIAKGFELASGEVLAYLNADDMYEPGGLLRVGEYFRDHPRAMVVYHEDTVAFDNWKVPNNGRRRADLIALLKGLILFQDGVFFRRQAYWRAGGLNRSLKLAGDWDLWARMARYYPLHRAPGHVSTFRIRPGQLSNNMGGYVAEIEQERPAHYSRLRYFGYLRHYPIHWFNRALNLLARLRRRRMFWPLDLSGLGQGKPPASVAPQRVWRAPRCPLTGRYPQRLLFSSRDTRFGDPLMNHVYYVKESDLAVTYPPLTKEQLNVLYERHYSNPPKEMIPPAPGESSPFAGYFGGSWFDRLLLKIPIPPEWTWKRLNWTDQTATELLDVLKGLVPPRGGEVAFLDVGCFEGKLLDAIGQLTDWKTCGIEANLNAVEVARSKGHSVWHGFAEDAYATIPAGRQFDVIFMGQVIEHLDDPLLVVRRLSLLLKPGGLLVMSTPNLRSKQIEIFGPTWGHWHVPYHRAIHSRRSLKLMATLSGMRLIRVRDFSHAYWTCISVAQNRIGLGGVVSHAVPFEADVTLPAGRIAWWSKMLWDRMGRGDYLFAVLKHR